MSKRAAVFAIPGDIETLTGGYIYERRLLNGLRGIGHDVDHLELPGSFPDPNPAEMVETVAALTHLPPERALILDGLVYGAIDPAGLARVQNPIVAMIHHPLAKETGLSAAEAQHLYETEYRNLQQAAAILVPSPHTAKILIGEYGCSAEKITIAPPGKIHPTRVRQPSAPPLILSVGILHPRKGHDILVKALRGLADLSWRAVIVGRAHDRAHAAELRCLIAELGLSDRVTLAGQVPQEALDRLYAEASVFALATRYEGYGIVLDEALSWGIPIISCATGAVPDTVPTEAGMLTPPDDPEAFSSALRDVLCDAGLAASMSKASAASGQKLPGWEETARIAGAVLDRL